MVKEIYVIKNLINEKVYVGQSVDSARRWRGHLSNAKHKNSWSAIDFAIAKYGAENFYYEVLETTEDYDNKEIYWINYYNSVMPNGYNYCSGGKGAGCGTGSPNGRIRNNEILEEIINKLLYTSESQKAIAEEYNLDKRVVSSINRGTAYRMNGLRYPLRKKQKDILEKDAVAIQLDLLSKQYTISQIAVKYGYSISCIEKINRGQIYKNINYSYPIYSGQHTKLPQEELLKLIDDLINSDIKISELALKYSISSTQIRNINKGKNNKQENLSYPLR